MDQNIILFLWLSNSPLCGYTKFCLSIQLLVDICIVSTFWLLWTVLLCTLVYKLSLSPCFQFFWIRIQKWVAGSYGHSVFSFLRKCQTFPQQLHHFTFPPEVQEGSNFSTPTLVILLIAMLMGIKWYLGTSLMAQWWRIPLPMQGQGFEPWSRKIPHAVEQLSTCAATTEARAPRARAPQRGPQQWEACAPLRRVAPIHRN